LQCDAWVGLLVSGKEGVALLLTAVVEVMSASRAEIAGGRDPDPPYGLPAGGLGSGSLPVGGRETPFPAVAVRSIPDMLIVIDGLGRLQADVCVPQVYSHTL